MTTFILRIIGILLEVDYPCRPALTTAMSARLSSKGRGADFCSTASRHLQFIRWFRSLGGTEDTKENRLCGVA